MMSRLQLRMLSLAFAFLLGAMAKADEPLEASVQRLAVVSRFAFGGIGYSGQRSKGEIDFKYVLSQPTPVALKAFERLYANGNDQAKAYALAGFRKLDLSRFKELASAPEASSEDVEVMAGCIVTHESLREVGDEIDRGRWRY